MAITNNLNNFDLVDTGTTGVYFSGGGGSPSLDTEIVIAGTNALGRRVTDTTAPGTGVGALGGSNNLSGNHVGTWVWVTQRNVLAQNYVVFSSQTAKNQIQNNYRAAPFTSYASEGGWQRVWFDASNLSYLGPNTSGTIDWTNINFVGTSAYFSSAPGGNAPNVWLDRIDYSKSSEAAVILTGTESLSSLAATDANGTNEWGVLRERNGVYNQYARVQYGTAASSVTINETDVTLAIVESGLVGTSFLGTNVNLENASTNVNFTDSTIFSADNYRIGQILGDFIVSGSSGTLSAVNLSLLTHRTVTLSPSVNYNGGAIQSEFLEQDGAHIYGGCILRTAAPISGSSFMIDPTFGTTSGLHNVTFKRSAAARANHHAIELTTGTSFTFTNINFEDYDSVSSDNAAVFNNTGGAITITRAGTTGTFSVRNGVGSSTTILGTPRNFELTGLKNGTEVRIMDQNSLSAVAGVESISAGVGTTIDNGDGTVTISGTSNNNTFNYAYQYSTSQSVRVAVINTAYEIEYFASVLADSDKSIPISQTLDRNYNDTTPPA